mgnify:CR=1 FL=1|jgi:hypothetical protein
MKAIIENGKVNYGIQSCLILTNGIGMVFQNNDLADKFALSLKKSGTIYIKNENYVEVLMIH